MVFFGEPMPADFKRAATESALASVDLLLILGTTLKVKPFGNVPFYVRKDAPRVLINRTNSDVSNSKAYTEDGQNNRLFLRDDCDSAVKRIVDIAGWKTDFMDLLPEKHVANY